MEIVLIAIASSWPVLVNTTDGVRSVDPAQIEMGRVYGLSPRQRLRMVVWPAALPQIFAGLRVAVGVSVAATVVANMFASNQGLGFYVINAYQSFNVVGTWSGLLMIGLLGCLVNVVFVLIEARALAWWRGARSATRST